MTDPDDAREPAGEAARQACANCGAGLDPDQAYCLECGEPTALAPPLRPRRRSALVAAAALLLIGGAAGVLGFAAGRGGDDATTSTLGTPGPATGAVTETSPVVSLPPDTTGGGTLPPVAPVPLPGATDGVTTASSTGTDPGTTVTDATVPTEPSTSTGATTSDTVPTDTTPPPSAGGGSDDWPTGTAGWTVQVASLRSRAAAAGLAKRIRAAGFPAGVLESSNHSSFRVGGYRVVFSGRYSTLVTARAQQRKLGRRYGVTIIRRISG